MLETGAAGFCDAERPREVEPKVFEPIAVMLDDRARHRG
jgi:hypothetical protein